MSSFRKLLELFGADGSSWGKNYFVQYFYGYDTNTYKSPILKRCLVGGLRTVQTGVSNVSCITPRLHQCTNPDVLLLAGIIRDNYPERIQEVPTNCICTLIAFNDHTATTFADVVAVLEKADANV